MISTCLINVISKQPNSMYIHVYVHASHRQYLGCGYNYELVLTLEDLCVWWRSYSTAGIHPHRHGPWRHSHSSSENKINIHVDNSIRESRLPKLRFVSLK